MFEQDLIVFGDQKTGDRIAGEIIGHALSKRIGDVGRRALELPWGRGVLDRAGRKQLRVMAEGADAIFGLQRVSRYEAERGIADRIVFGGTVIFGPRT